MAEYRDYRDWNGEWEGSYDGRFATARIISSLDPDGRRARLHITYEFGGDAWESEITDDFDALSHEVTNQWLRPTGGAPHRQRLEWPRLHMHTWDTNFISGISRWDGKDYGFWFRRRGTQGPTYIEHKPFTSWYNLDGRGDHPHETGIAWSGPPVPEQAIGDGRPIRLAINVNAYGPHPENDVFLDFRFIDVGGRWWRATRVARPREFWIDDLDLQPYHHGGDPAGEGTIHLRRFCLHTWDTGQASGWTEWEGKRYGMLLHNGSPARWT